MSKITLKDYISWGLVVLFGIIAVIEGMQKRQAVNTQNSIRNSAQTLYQYFTTNNYNFPTNVMEAVDNIATASGVVVKPATFLDIKTNKNE